MTSQTIDQILHDIFALAIGAAAVFVKNPATAQHAASLIQLATSLVLPIADGLINPPPKS